MNKKKIIKNIAFVILAMFFVGDRILKFLFINHYLGSVKILGDFFSLNLTPNYYIAFSLPLGGIGLSIFISLIVLAFLGYVIHLILAREDNNFEFIPLTFVLFGAISNLADRWRYDYVIDYLDLKYFTVFNLADVMIVGGVAYIIYIQFFNKKLTK
jgi:signal peptidase II